MSWRIEKVLLIPHPGFLFICFCFSVSVCERACVHFPIRITFMSSCFYVMHTSGIENYTCYCEFSLADF